VISCIETISFKVQFMEDSIFSGFDLDRFAAGTRMCIKDKI
jgi:hypothetical protein